MADSPFWRAYAEYVPTKVRMYARGLFGDASPIDETYMQPSDLDSIRQLISQKGGQSGAITYADYAPYMQDNGTFSDWATKARETLGQFKYSTDQEGNVRVYDRYDFNPVYGPTGDQKPSLADYSEAFRNLVVGSPYKMAHAIGSDFIPSDGRHGYDVNLNLGNRDAWAAGNHSGRKVTLLGLR